MAGVDNASLHRIEPRLARDLLHKVDFLIEVESDLFDDPEDDHSLMVHNEEIYRRTVRFFFKAVKPVK